jgi:crotonobetainyl-CoA:carnitine CoA-transferase CaiB-like acyl-CoA transferase
MAEQEGSLLGGCRVLDLADEKGLLCGKLLGDLGADVIKIEPPGGDPARSIGPFYEDIPHPEKSLFWFWTNLHKRGITLDIETSDGREIFKRLVGTADFVVESFEPGYMESLGLGYSELEKINPGIIMTSITPFGQTGPYAHYKTTDIVGVSMGGLVRISGEMGGPPNRFSTPQFYFLGGLHGAAGSMVAYYHRELTGEGQHVDVSCQQAVVLSLMVVAEIWDMFKYSYRGMGGSYAGARPDGTILFSRVIYPCKDGHVFAFITGAAQAGMVKSSQLLVEWANREGMCLELKDYPWQKIDAATISQEELSRITESIAAFIETRTKAELFSEALKSGILICPVSTMKDIVESPQLMDREFWEEVEHPELGTTITYPGYAIKMSETPYRVQRRPPLIGEHNEQVYEKEMGYSREQLVTLKNRGVI